MEETAGLKDYDVPEEGETLLPPIPPEREDWNISRELESQFFPLFQQAAVGFGKVGLKGEWLSVNQKLCEMTGYTQEELLALTFQDITHPDDVEADVTNMHKVLNRELDINILEKRYICKDGGIVWVHLTATLVRDEKDEPAYFITIIEDITPRKNVERELKAFQERHHLILRGTEDGIWDWDILNDKYDWNERISEILGVSIPKEQQHRQTFLGFVHPEDRQQLEAALRSHLETGSKYEVEFRLIQPSGEVRYCVDRADVLRDELGKPYRMAGAITDVTKRKQAEERLNFVIDGSNDGIWDLDLEQHVSYFNSRFCDILGLSQDGFTADESVWDLIHPEDLPGVQALFYKHLEDPDVPYDIQFRMRHTSGQYRYVHSRARAIRDGNGKPYRMSGLVTDITERVLAELELQKSLERETLVRRIGEEIGKTFDVQQIVTAAAREIGEFFKVDRSVIYTYEYDPTLERFLYRLAAQHCFGEGIIPIDVEESNAYSKTGLSRDLKGTDEAYVVATHTPEEYLEVLKQYVRKIEIPLEDPTAVLEEHISRYQLKSVLGLEIFYKGYLYGGITLHQCTYNRQWTQDEIDLLQDIATHVGTGLYQAESYHKEQRAREDAQTANQRKDQFLSNMSHELRTPLNAVIGFAEMLLEGYAGALNEKQARYSYNIVSSGKHLLDMVNDLLDISKIEAGQLRITPEWLALPPLLGDVENTLNALAAKSQISLVFRVEDELQEIHADPVRLKQILYNLVSNGIKFNHPQGQVTVAFSLSKNRNWNVCQVIDTGIGIPEEEIPNLFTMFYQVDSSFSRKIEGTGLGLALTKRLIELHGGNISVSQNPSGGSTFTFRLPKIIPE